MATSQTAGRRPEAGMDSEPAWENWSQGSQKKSLTGTGYDPIFAGTPSARKCGVDERKNPSATARGLVGVVKELDES